MKLEFYRQKATPNRINKAPYLERLGEINEVVIKQTDNELTPDFVLATSPLLNNANYFWCDFTQRFYFITSFDVTTGRRMIIHSRVDVLMTFRNEILGSSAWVDVSDKTSDTSDGYQFLHNDYPFRQDYDVLGKSSTGTIFGPFAGSGLAMVLIMK